MFLCSWESNREQVLKQTWWKQRCGSPSPARKENAHERCDWSLLHQTSWRCPPDLQTPQCTSQSPHQTAAPSCRLYTVYSEGLNILNSWAFMLLRLSVCALTGAKPWSCVWGRQDGSSCTPPPPSLAITAGFATYCVTLATCHGCGW